MIAMGATNLPERAMRQQIAAAIQIVIQQTRLSDGTRKVISISEITGMVEYLDRKYYKPRKLQMRACHPRDLISQVVDICRYTNREPLITRELLDSACGSYFLEESASQGSGN